MNSKGIVVNIQLYDVAAAELRCALTLGCPGACQLMVPVCRSCFFDIGMLTAMFVRSARFQSALLHACQNSYLILLP